jgi:hypothetical protein
MGSVSDLLHHDPMAEDLMEPSDALLGDHDKDDQSPASPADDDAGGELDNSTELPGGYVLECLGKLLLRCAQCHGR